MEDFRLDFYNKYQSTFKQEFNKTDIKTLDSSYRYFSFKYLPLINKFKRTASILDLGCGQGELMEFLIKAGFDNIKGIDISEEQIKIAKDKALNVNIADAFQFLDLPEQFDIIFATDFIEHFKKEELYHLATKIYSRLSPNGCLILRTPNGNGIYPNKIIYGDLTHLTIFNHSSLSQLLKLVDFKKIEFYETGPVPNSLKGFFGFILWKLVRVIFNFVRFIEVGQSEKYLTQEFICKANK